jgi:hypothetical protein
MRIKAIGLGLFSMVIGLFIIWGSFTVEPVMWEIAAIGLLVVIVGPLVAWWAFQDLTRRGGSKTEAAEDMHDLFG